MNILLEVSRGSWHMAGPSQACGWLERRLSLRRFTHLRYVGRFLGAGVLGMIWSARVNPRALGITCEAVSWLLGDDTRMLVYV